MRRGVRHGFGVRGSAEPEGCLRPRQVHGAAVLLAEELRPGRSAPEADAIVAATPGAVAAVHAGWRGLARGVVEAGVAALARASGEAPARIAGAIGPHIGACCYEVDAPVLDAIGARLGADALASATPVRRGHWRLDIGGVAALALARAGVREAEIGRAAALCTACDPARFHSYRRDGAAAGRLVHFVEVPRPSGGVRQEA